MSTIALLSLTACGQVNGLDRYPWQPSGPSLATQTGPPVMLTSNVVDPASVNAVSKFNSCVGHAYPLTSSPNSGKNYFWPTSANLSSISRLRIYAPCDGFAGQAPDDLFADTPYDGQAIHFYCENSSTSLRYFHVNVSPAIAGQHFRAGDALGFFYGIPDGQPPTTLWQLANNFDVAVSDGDDAVTTDYFAKLSTAALAAWAGRGLTSVAQTVVPGDPACSSYGSNIGQADIFVFTPAL